MSFTLPQYHEPDFQETRFQSAPEARFEPAPKDGVAPEGYHATTIYPEYFKVGGRWLLAEESRMDCVAALRDGKIAAVEFRNLKAGEPVAVGRTEDASEGIYVYPFGFAEEKGEAETFAFRQGRSRETAYSMDYDSIYNHIDTLNAIRLCGSTAAFVEAGKAKDGIIYECVRNHIPYVLVGSVRDDGPLPEVYGNVYEGQDAMRALVREATTVICMASTLHTVATGNMTPSYRVVDGVVRPVYFYSVDVSEFAVNKLRDRGSLSVRTIVTNVQDFVVNVCKGVL